MRKVMFAMVLAVWPGLAMADETIAGQWQADMGQGVVISMDVIADGHWASQTVQDDKLVAEMAGTYQQTKRDETSGQILFLPISSNVTGEHGAAVTELDTYTLDPAQGVLTLVTGGEAMEFHKQSTEKDATR